MKIIDEKPKPIDEDVEDAGLVAFLVCVAALVSMIAALLVLIIKILK